MDMLLGMVLRKQKVNWVNKSMYHIVKLLYKAKRLFTGCGYSEYEVANEILHHNKCSMFSCSKEDWRKNMVQARNLMLKYKDKILDV